MAIRVVCASCSRAMRVADDLAGRKVRCRDCGEPIPVVAEARADSGPPSASARPRPGQRASEPGPASPTKRPSSNRPAPATTEPDEPEVTVRRVSRPRRKKRRRRERDEQTSYNWLWWVGAGVTAAAVAGILVAVAHGNPLLVVGYSVVLAIMVVISAVILIVSMIISSMIIGGMEFGELHVVIAKSIILLLVVDLIIMLVPYGGYVTLPIWLLGLMGLFRLDFLETRLLFVVNWGLNFILRMFLMGMLMSSALHHGKNTAAPPQPPADRQNAPVDEQP